MNNVCEVFNAKILNYIGKPILTLAEEVRCYVMRKKNHNKMKLDGRVIRVPYPLYFVTLF
jgi:hypothetical protein